MAEAGERRFVIRLEGGPADAGRVPLSELLRVGRQVHALLRDVATVLAARPTGRPGRPEGFIERAVELQVVASPQRGSFVLELELPPESPTVDQELEGMELEPRLGERALDHLVAGVEALDKSTDTLPVGFNREVLRTIDRFRPTLRKGIKAVALESDEAEPHRARIDAERLDAAHRLITQPVKGAAVAEGKLEMVDRARLLCRIDRPERPGIPCHFPDRLRGLMSDALGQHVRVLGEGHFPPGADEPSKIEAEDLKVIAVQETLDIDPEAFSRERGIDELAEDQGIVSSDAFLSSQRLSWMDDEEATKFLRAAKGEG